MTENKTQGPEKCPASGRTARWCLDQTHTLCWAALHESVTLDRKVERMLG